MKFKVWSKEDLINNEVFDGATIYNTIESYITSDHVNPHDLQRSTQNIYTNTEDIYKYLNSIARISSNKGVIKSPMTKDFEGVFQSVTLNGITKDYVYLKSGIARISNFTIVNHSNLFTTARQIEKILNLDDTEDEKVEINYDLNNDVYSAIITKLNSSTGLLENDVYSNFTNSIALLESIYNNYVIEFDNAISADLTKLDIEDTLVELSSSNQYYWKIDISGNIIINTIPSTVDEISLQNIIYDNSTNSGTYSSYTDKDYAIKNSNEFNENVFFNVGDHPDFDTTSITDVLDYTTTYPEIGNEDSFLVFMRTGGSAGNESGVFGWSESNIDTIDKYGANITDGKVFYMNKDFVVRYGTNTEDIIKFSNLVANASSSTPTVDTYDELSSTPSNGTDGAVVFVRELNELYRYSSASQTWVNLSDRHKQFAGVTQVKIATDFEAGGTDYTIYKFDAIEFKTDGTNIDVFVNGIHQDMGAGSGFDYTILNKKTIVFNTPLDNDPANTFITLKIIVGGENFYPERRTYIIGTSSDEYTGSTSEIKTDFHVMPNRIDVFLSGSLLAESEYVKTIGSDGIGSVTSAADTTHFTDTNEDFTGMGNYFIIFINTASDLNSYEVRRIASVSTDTITLDSPLPTTLSIDDNYMIAEDYDYFVNEYKDIVYLSDPASTDEIVQIRDRAGLVSTYETMAGGSSLPDAGIFGQEYYVDPYWYKWNGSEWQQMNGDGGGGASTSITEFTTAENITKSDIVALNTDGKIIKADTSDSFKYFIVGVALNDANSGEKVNVQKSGLNSLFYDLQYNTGLVTTDGTNPTVTGNGTAFTSNIIVGDYFQFQGNPNFHKIISVNSDTQLTLETVPVAATGATYAINRGRLEIGKEYFGGTNADTLVSGNLQYNYYKVFLGYSKSSYQLDLQVSNAMPTIHQDSFVPIGVTVEYPNFDDLSAYGFLPYDFNNKVSKYIYPILWDKVGHQFNEAHKSVGDLDLSSDSTYFYPTPPPGFYNRTAIPDSSNINSTSDVDTSTDRVTLSLADFDRFKRMKYWELTTDGDGVPVYLKKITGDLPTGLSENTLYYIRFVDSETKIEFYLTEKDAIEQTNIVDITATATGTFVLTQEGIVLDDTFQGHEHGIKNKIPSGSSSEEIANHNPDTSAGTNIGTYEIREKNGYGTPRTSNETRPKTALMYKYIKAEYVTTAGEPISALRYDTGWIAHSDWTDVDFDITHNLDTTIDKLNINFLVSLSSDGSNAINIQDVSYYDYSSGSMGYTFEGIDSNSIKIRIGTAGLLYLNTANGAANLNGVSAYYKIVITKPNLVSTVFDVSAMRKEYDISSSNQTVTLPELTGVSQIREYSWTGGDGTYKLTFSVPDNTGVCSTSEYEGEGEGKIKFESTILSSGGYGWKVVDYEDSWDVTGGKIEKYINGKMVEIASVSLTDPSSSAANYFGTTAGTIYYSDTTVTLNGSFNSIYTIDCRSNISNSRDISSFLITTTSFSFRLAVKDSSITGVTGYYTVIGTWK